MSQRAALVAPIRSRRHRRTRRRHPLFSMLAGTLAVVLGIGAIVAVDGDGQRAVAADTLLVSTSASASANAAGETFVLAGDELQLTLTVQNITAPAEDLYNAALTLLVPVGLEFVSGGTLLGAPRVIPGPADGVDAGQQLWVWEDIADLPAGASLSSSVTVRPAQPVDADAADDETVFPVGSIVSTTTSAYASHDARLLPVFPGSTGAAVDTEHNATGNQAPVAVPVQAIDVTKSEPSIEAELLRGAHDEHTTYTITVRNTAEGATHDVVVVDYLPAGLEYLGDGVDHGSAEEYPGSGPIAAGTPPAGYRPADRVETILAGALDPAWLTPGEVYTKVTWNLGALAPEQVVTIQYLAAVPLFENAMWPADATPDPASGEQAANLDNNTGASTREGSTDPDAPRDGMLLTNSAVAAGQYQGIVRTGTDRATEDSAAVTVTAEDLAIHKSHPTGAVFEVGGDVDYTLTLRTGEYASASDLVVVDVLPDGLYPRLPEALEGEFSGLPAEWFDADFPPVVGATVTGIDYVPTAGTITITFMPTGEESPFVLEPGGTHEIVYSVGMRTDYERSTLGYTTSGDSFTNVVEVRGATTPLPSIGAEVRYASDASEATIGSTGSSVTKEVLTRDGLLGFIGGVPDADPAEWVDGTTTVPGGFTVGDTVVYRITVDFPGNIDTRQPVITDMLPAGVSLAGWAHGPGDTVDASERVAPEIEGGALRWALGAVHDPSGNRFVTAGSRLELLVWGTVDTLSVGTAAASEETLDKPENLAKYRYENVDGEVFFARDQASILVEPGISLLKGVRDVDGDDARAAQSSSASTGSEFDSNRDGIVVVHDEEVTYRIDLDAPGFATRDIVVWDALPQGIDASMVTGFAVTDRDGGPVGTAFIATPLDPLDPGYPAEVHAGFDDRTLIVWEIDSMPASTDVAAAGLSLQYTVRIPQEAIVDERFDNLASIVRYDTVPNGGGTGVTLVPDSPLSTVAADEGAGEVAIDGQFTTDDSWVQLPPATIEKVLVATEIDAAQNSAAQAVQGESITYRYALTVPDGTTIPAGSTLADGGKLARNAAMTSTVRDYTRLADAALVGPDHGADLTLTPAGVLTFAAPFVNDTGAPAVFTVELVVFTNGAGFAHGNTLYNRAAFTNGATGATLTDTATVTYRTIAPTLGKTVEGVADHTTTANQVVEFVLTASNPSTRPTSYDTVVVDCVPGALTLHEPIAGATVTTDVACAGGSLITWTAGALAPGQTATLTYSATVDPDSAGSAIYVNEATLTGYTLPDDLDSDPIARRGAATDDASATVRIVPAEIDKVAVPDSATIGDVIDFTVTTTLPADVNFYDAVLRDALPNGLVVVPATVEIASDDPDLTFTPTAATSSTVLEWDVTDDGESRIEADPAERTITLTYQARVVEFDAARPARGDVLTNTAVFRWSTEPGGAGSEESVTATENVEVIEPRLVIAKKVDGADEARVALDDTVEYTVTVTNTGDAASHNMVVTDIVPDGVIVTGTISHGGQLTGATATGGGTITWDASDLPGPLAPGDAITLTYQARLAEPADLDPSAQSPVGWWTNTAAITHYESHPDSDHSRDYDPTDLTDTARVMPLFPHVALAKAVGAQGTIAYLGEPFEWRLTLTSTGLGAAQTVTAIDTLPENWSYVSGSALVAIAGAAPVALEPDVNGRELTWQLGTSGGAPVLAGATAAVTQSIVITFQAIPTEDAAETPGIGGGVLHTNTLSAEVTDVTGATTNGEGPREYVGPDADASARIHVADLELVKSGAAEPLVAGDPASTGWTLTVRNLGDDPAVGPFLITDVTDALPDGVTITGHTGAGWTVDSQSVTDGVVTTVYRYGTASTTLASGAALPVLGITVRVAADFDPASLPTGLIDNAAVVTSPTHDPDPDNNESSDEVEITTAADLEIVKSVTTASPNAGSAITWRLDVTNHGPSVSRATAADPITVTDVIPDGVTDVTVPTLPLGWTSSIPSGESLSAGDTLTLTYVGEPLKVGATVSFTVTGTVLASHLTGTIANTATVEPGATDDPEPDNNDDTITTPVGIATTLGVSKTRVELVDGRWEPATGEIVAGEPVTYRIVVVNSGPADAVGVTITDTLTAGLVGPVAHTPVEGTWVPGAATATTFVFELEGTLAVGSSASLLVTATADSTLTPDDDVVNSALATAENDPEGDDDEDTGDPVRVADLEIVKRHDATATPVAGGTLDYTIEVTNLGPSSATGPFVITDTLPAGFSYVSGTALVDGVVTEPVGSGQTLTWTVGDAATSLPVGGTIVVELTTLIDAAADAGAYENTATIDSPDDDNPLNDTTTDEVQVTTSADVTILKEVSADPHVAGGTVTYTLTIENEGPSVARAVQVTDAPDAGLTITGMSGADWDCVLATATCTSLGLLPVGMSTITVTATIASHVPDGTTLENIATVGWTDSDGPHESDDDEAITVEAIADLSVVKLLASPTLDAGTVGRYRIEVGNAAGASDAVSVTVTDVLPTGLAYAGALISADSAWTDAGTDSDGNRVFALTGSLPAGASTWLEFDVAVDADVTGEVTNVAVVRSPVDPDEPEDGETTTVGTSTNLSILKERVGTPGEARIGDTTQFRITVTNDGPATATGVEVADALPTGLTFAGVTTPAEGAGWTFAPVGDELTASLDDSLEVGASASFIVTALVEVAAYPVVVNTAEVTGDNPETDDDDNLSEVEVPVAPQVDLEIVKELVSDELVVGETAVYRLTVTNHGGTEDPGPITVRDVLPTGLAYVDSDTAECGAVDDQVECVFSQTLGIDETIVIELTVEVLAEAHPEVANTATVSTESEDTDPDNNASTVVAPVVPDVRFAIQKWVAASTDDTVTWEVTVTAIGLNDAFEGFEVTDTLPAELAFVAARSADGITCAVGADGELVCVHPDPLASGASATVQVLTTTSQKYGSTVTNTVEVTDGFIVDPDEPVTASAQYTRNLSMTGWSPWALAALALLTVGGGLALTTSARMLARRG